MRHCAPAKLTVAVITIVVTALAFHSYPLSGQSRNPIQAARDAINAARQQPQNPPAQSQRGAQPSNPTAASNAPASPTGDCCSPNALKELAGVNGKLDILGIKLGMTLDEATAVIKAANPKLKIEILYTELRIEGKPPMRVPHWVLAHTFGGVANPVFFHSPDGSQESVALELTLPPNTPVVSMISRHVQFKNGEPVVASTLAEALRKKYGTQHQELISLNWVYDTSGKQVTAPRECLKPNAVDGFPVEMRGGEDLRTGGSWQSFNLDFIKSIISSNAKCAQYTNVVAFELGQAPPNSQRGDLWVGIFSGPLLSRSLSVTGAYMQKAIDDQTKQQEDAAKQRTAPKL